MKKFSLLICLFIIQISLGQEALPEDLKIAFVSYKTGSAEVYLMNTDGSEVEQITNSPENNSFPYQIDKRTIGFTRTDSLYNTEKFKIDILTKKEERIIEQPIVKNAKWEEPSRDNQFVAFVRSTDYSDRELFIYDRNSKKEIQITDNGLESYKALSVGYSWSENGRYLIFMSGPDWYNQFIRRYDLKEEKLTTITDRGYMNSGIKWLKDNQTLIANLKIKDQTYYELYSVNTSNGQLVQLTEDINLHPNVSPDGEWIVFESQRHQNDGEVYIMRKDGTDQRRLTSNNDYNGRCTWFQL